MAKTIVEEVNTALLKKAVAKRYIRLSGGSLEEATKTLASASEEQIVGYFKDFFKLAFAKKIGERVFIDSEGNSFSIGDRSYHVNLLCNVPEELLHVIENKLAVGGISKLPDNMNWIEVI